MTENKVTFKIGPYKSDYDKVARLRLDITGYTNYEKDPEIPYWSEYGNFIAMTGQNKKEFFMTGETGGGYDTCFLALSKHELKCFISHLRMFLKEMED